MILGLGRVEGSHRLSDCPYVHKATFSADADAHRARQRADGRGACCVGAMLVSMLMHVLMFMFVGLSLGMCVLMAMDMLMRMRTFHG